MRREQDNMQANQQSKSKRMLTTGTSAKCNIHEKIRQTQCSVMGVDQDELQFVTYPCANINQY